MKTKLLFFTSILVLLLLLSYKTISTPTKLKPGESWVDLASTDIIGLEKKIDRNIASWKIYKDSTTEIKMPIYLGEFNDISATELTRKDEYVANYRRPSHSSTEGRSYWIIILRPQHNTQKEDVEKWIIKNKLNYIEEIDQEFAIEQVPIGGKTGYRVKMFETGGIPGIERIYFQTREGIKAIGFHSRSPSKGQVANDYQIYQDILTTFRFTDQFE